MTRTHPKTTSAKIEVVTATAATMRVEALVLQAGAEYATSDAQNGAGNGWG